MQTNNTCDHTSDDLDLHVNLDRGLCQMKAVVINSMDPSLWARWLTSVQPVLALNSNTCMGSCLISWSVLSIFKFLLTILKTQKAVPSPSLMLCDTPYDFLYVTAYGFFIYLFIAHGQPLWNFLFHFQVVLAACCLSVSMVTYSSFQNFTAYSVLHVHTWMSSVYGMDSGIGIISEFILWFLCNKVRCSDMWHETSFRKYSCFASMTRSNCMCPVHCSSDQDTATSSCSRQKQI